MTRASARRNQAHRSTTPAPWRLPTQLQQRGTKLLTQQCWYWGFDVRRPEGNLLLDYGFARYRSPEGQVGSSMYVLAPKPELQVTLWSFGFSYRHRELGRLYLNRFAFDPLLIDAEELALGICLPDQLPPQRRATSRAEQERLALLLAESISWIVEYERWVLEQYGLDYRRSCLAQWSRQKPALPPEQVILHWEALACACAAACAVASGKDEAVQE